jgi:hypothetical protein
MRRHAAGHQESGVLYLQRPPRPIASVGYSGAGESLIRSIAQRRLLVGLENKYVNRLVRGV